MSHFSLQNQTQLYMELNQSLTGLAKSGTVYRLKLEMQLYSLLTFTTLHYSFYVHKYNLHIRTLELLFYF